MVEKMNTNRKNSLGLFVIFALDESANLKMGKVVECSRIIRYISINLNDDCLVK